MARKFKVGDVVMIKERVEPGGMRPWPKGRIGEVLAIATWDGDTPFEVWLVDPITARGIITGSYDLFAASELHYIGRL